MTDPERRDEPEGRRVRPPEKEAVRTTIVGGRPPGSGKSVGPIPRGIEVLLKKAAVDTEFRRVLLAKRAEAAREIGLALVPAEAAMLAAVPAAQLGAIIDRTTVTPSQRPAFLGRAAALMLVALGAGTFGCKDEAPASWGDRPDRPLEATAPASPVQPPAPLATDGIRPGQPSAATPAPPADATTVQPQSAPDAATVSPAPTPPPGPPAPTGIRPDRPPAAAPPTPVPPMTKGIQPDRPDAAPAVRPQGAAKAVVLHAPAPPPPTPAPGPSEPVTRGIRPDRPTAPPPPASPAGSTTPAAKPEPIISRVLALPSDWDEQRTLNELAQGLKRLAEARLPEHRFIFSVADSGQRYVRVEWKAREYEAPAGPAATASGQTATAGKSAETGPTPKRKGPAEDGLLLTAWLETRLTEADRPRTFDNAGLWKTRNDQAYLIPLRTYLKFNVHYGKNTAADLVAAFSTPREWFAGALPKGSQPTVETRIAVPTEAVPTFVPGGAQAQPSSGSAGIAPDRPPAGTLGIQPDRPAR